MDAGKVNEKYQEAARTIVAEVQDYWLNSAFLVGKQWSWYNRHTNQLEEWRADDPERVQAVMNRLWPASRTIVSKLLQRQLTFEVMPSAPDDATMRGAATAEAVLSDTALRHRWEDIRTKNAWGTWKGGTAAICVDWDPSAGVNVGTLRGEDGETPVYSGDTVETPLTISEFVVEPGARDPERARWWIKAQSLPPEQVQRTYGLKKAPEADATYGVGTLQQGLLAVEHQTGNQKPKLTRVLTYYERPSADSKGMIAVVIGNKFAVDPKPWPFPFTDRLNLAVTYETEMENRWTGETVVSMARPVQVLYNLALSNVAEHMKNAGNARMAVPQSSVNLIESLSDLPGEMFPYPDGTAAPTWLSPPQMPNWWAEWPSRLAEEMDDLLGVHNVSRGQAPANIESGYGLSILAEHDSTPVGRMVKSEADAWSKVGTMVLELFASQVKERRQSMIRAAGEVPEAVTWTGKDLFGQTQAVVPVDAILPRSRAALMAMAEKLVQMGLVQDLETFSALAELPEQRDMLDRARPDAAKARRENSMMALGRVQIPADFDDHTVHIAEHNVFRKSARYEKMTPELQAVVDDHIQAHSTMAGELAGQARQGAAIDPMAAAIPQADSRPTIAPEQLPPDAFAAPDPAMLPSAEPSPEELLAALADASTTV